MSNIKIKDGGYLYAGENKSDFFLIEGLEMKENFNYFLFIESSDNHSYCLEFDNFEIPIESYMIPIPGSIQVQLYEKNSQDEVIALSRIFSFRIFSSLLSDSSESPPPYEIAKSLAEQAIEAAEDASSAAERAEIAATDAEAYMQNAVGRKGIGANAEIFNDYSHNKASGRSAHAEGEDSTASGICAHAEGANCKATHQYSHAEGVSTKASGVSSHAEGYISIASGFSSHAEGYCTIASGANSHVQGKYNIPDEKGEFAHIIGNGSGDIYRANAHTIDWNGNAWYAGKISAGMIDNIPLPSADNDLIPKKYLDDALANISIGAPAWQKIASISINEEVREISISQDESGNSFELSEFIIIGKFVGGENQSSANSLRIHINDELICYLPASIIAPTADSERNRSFIRGEFIAGLGIWDILQNISTALDSTSQLLQRPIPLISDIKNRNPAASINLIPNGSLNKFGVGTSIEIWGRGL